MNELSIQCPICSLFLLPGMVLEEHLETHPKEQVIQALVRFASSKGKAGSSAASSSSAAAIPSSSQQHQQQQQPHPQQKPKPRGLLTLLPPPPPPPAPQFPSVPRNGGEFVTDSPFNVMGQLTNHPPQPQQHIPGASKNMMIVNRQNTLVYHQSAGGTNFQHPHFQIFNYQPTANKPMQPPPTYGTAISQLRSQNNQINNSLNPYNNNVSTNYLQNLQNFNSTIGGGRNSPHARPSSRRSTMSPRVNFSPRPSPSPSVLRYAESPVTAHFTESDNGFIVQESPRHVVEYIEKENGEMAVTEKIVEFKPSVVAITEETRIQFQEDEVQSDSNEESQKEEAPKTTNNKDDTSSASLLHDKSTFKVLSNVQVNQNEYKDLYENLFPFNKSIKSEKTISESIIQETPEDPAESSSSSDVQQTTSVIRATPGCSKHMFNKKAPKKLVIKNKKRQISQEISKSKEEDPDDDGEDDTNQKTETFESQPPSTTVSQERAIEIEDHDDVTMEEDYNHFVKIEKLDENARTSPPPTSQGRTENHLQTFEITTNIVDSEIFNEDAVEEFTSNYHNDNSSIHVNFPTSSSSLDGSEIIIPDPIQQLKVDNDVNTISSNETGNSDNTTEKIQTTLEETHIVHLKDEKESESCDKKEKSEDSQQKTPPLFPLSAIFSKPSTSASVFKCDFRDSQEQKPSNSSYNDFSSYNFLYPNVLDSTEHKVKANISSEISDIEDEDDKNNYLDLDTCKGGYSQIMDTLNIQTDEKMPAKGEISEQESNGDIENSWNHSVYNESSSRFPNPYEAFLSSESWSHEEYFQPQDLNLPSKLRVSPQLSLHKQLQNCTQSSSSNDVSATTSSDKNFPSTSSGQTKKIRKTILTTRPKTFTCEHCQTVFSKLKERNAHLIKVHNYVRVNRRLYRKPPSATETSQSLNNSNVEDISKSDIKLNLSGEDVKTSFEKVQFSSNENEQKSMIVRTTTAKSLVIAGTTKYDSIRAQLYRMLMNFNLGVKKESTNEEIDPHFFESHSFCCFTCKQDFISVKLFDEHLATHPAECFTCHKKFSRWHYFSVHLKRHLGWKDFACNICNKKFVVKGALLEHTRMHSGESPLKCKICSKTFKRYSNLTQHVRVIHGNKKRNSKDYVCFCGAVLPTKARFLWHKEIHDVKPKCCQYCRDRFIHLNSLRRHIRLAHADKFDYNEPVECPRCNQVYSKGSIKTHLATHSMDTQHECNICNKSFSTKWNLKIHSWVHANRTSKPYKCGQCTKAFVREIDFQNHLNSHKQIKPFTCEYCGCKFIRKYNYMRHWREHQNDKKFSCDVCGKAFHRRYYLIEHSRIHTGERPFLCTICGKSSTTKTNHNKHLKIHNSRDPFTSEA